MKKKKRNVYTVVSTVIYMSDKRPAQIGNDNKDLA